MAKAKMILVVDDDPNLIMFFKEFFKQEGYNSLCIDDPEKAVRTSNLIHPDLLIIDVKMPKIDGFGVLAKVRDSTPDIKTIIISAYLNEVHEDKIKASGVQAVLKKPVQFEELERWILKLLNLTKEEIQERLPSGTGTEKIRILFVDDESDVLNTVAETFNEYGFQMDTAKSGEEGLEKVKAKQYDILITDNSMNGMSGYDMVKKIRVESRYKPSVIAVASAMLTQELKDKYRGLGITHFIDKPMKFEEVIQWLESQTAELSKGKPESK